MVRGDRDRERPVAEVQGAVDQLSAGADNALRGSSPVEIGGEASMAAPLSN